MTDSIIFSTKKHKYVGKIIIYEVRKGSGP